MVRLPIFQLGGRWVTPSRPVISKAILEEMAPYADIKFERLAVNPLQFARCTHDDWA